jgi:hypothetical protein
MVEQQAEQPTSGDAGAVSEAYAAARELLRLAEEHAEQLRSDADRYARRREQEADLLVAKARRLLEVAEGRAGAIESAAGHPSLPAPPPRHLRRDDGPESLEESIDLDAAKPAQQIRTDLDRMLADAIAHAVDGSFTTGP